LFVKKGLENKRVAGKEHSKEPRGRGGGYHLTFHKKRK